MFLKKRGKYIMLILVLIGIIFSATFVLDTDRAIASTSYKIVKGKLVNAKTKKVIKGYVLYKKKLYKDGKTIMKPTLYKKKLYQKGGSLYKGKKIFKGKQYVNGKYKVDNTKPVIIVPKTVQSHYYIINGETFIIPTMTANDKISGKVKVTTSIKNSANKTVKKIDTTIADDYTITYSAKDGSGNKTTKKIIVTVIAENDFEVIDIH